MGGSLMPKFTVGEAPKPQFTVGDAPPPLDVPTNPVTIQNLTKIEPFNARPGIGGHIETALGNIGAGLMQPLNLIPALEHPVQTELNPVDPSIPMVKDLIHNPSGTIEAGAGALSLGGLGDLADMVPTRAKAGALLDQVMQSAKDEPVNMTRSLPKLERIGQLTEAGGPVLRPADLLYKRVNTVNPLPYAEARDFYSNLSRLSAADRMALNGPMNKALAEFVPAFKEDIGEAAERAGKGPEYEKGMRDYARAAKLRNLIEQSGKTLKPAAKYGIPAAAGYELGKHFLTKLVP